MWIAICSSVFNSLYDDLSVLLLVSWLSGISLPSPIVSLIPHYREAFKKAQPFISSFRRFVQQLIQLLGESISAKIFRGLSCIATVILARISEFCHFVALITSLFVNLGITLWSHKLLSNTVGIRNVQIESPNTTLRQTFQLSFTKFATYFCFSPGHGYLPFSIYNQLSRPSAEWTVTNVELGISSYALAVRLIFPQIGCFFTTSLLGIIWTEFLYCVTTNCISDWNRSHWIKSVREYNWTGSRRNSS